MMIFASFLFRNDEICEQIVLEWWYSRAYCLEMMIFASILIRNDDICEHTFQTWWYLRAYFLENIIFASISFRNDDIASILRCSCICRKVQVGFKRSNRWLPTGENIKQVKYIQDAKSWHLNNDLQSWFDEDDLI